VLIDWDSEIDSQVSSSLDTYVFPVQVGVGVADEDPLGDPEVVVGEEEVYSTG
jgi:hypothetical protein